MYKAIFSQQYSQLIDWLVRKRKESHISQRTLASELQIHHSIVGKVESRERRLDVVEYLQFCEALDIDPIEGMHAMIAKKDGNA